MISKLALTSKIATVVAILASMAWAGATPPDVTFEYGKLSGGRYEYFLTVNNTGGAEPLDGLIVLNGNSIFNLNVGSAIGSPTNWGAFAPIPGFVDNLFYFSMSSGSNIPVNGSMAGFSFISTMNPTMLAGSDFAVEGIGANSAQQIPLGNAVPVPEPETFEMAAMALLGVVAFARRKWEM